MYKCIRAYIYIYIYKYVYIYIYTYTYLDNSNDNTTNNIIRPRTAGHAEPRGYAVLWHATINIRYYSHDYTHIIIHMINTI